MGESSAGSYLADPTSPIPSHCAVIILFKSVAVHQLLWLALKELHGMTWHVTDVLGVLIESLLHVGLYCDMQKAVLSGCAVL